MLVEELHRPAQRVREVAGNVVIVIGIGEHLDRAAGVRNLLIQRSENSYGTSMYPPCRDAIAPAPTDPSDSVGRD